MYANKIPDLGDFLEQIKFPHLSNKSTGMPMSFDEGTYAAAAESNMSRCLLLLLLLNSSTTRSLAIKISTDATWATT